MMQSPSLQNLAALASIQGAGKVSISYKVTYEHTAHGISNPDGNNSGDRESKPISDCNYTKNKNVLLNGTDYLLYIHMSDNANKSFVIL
jgi:hypothetical protein